MQNKELFEKTCKECGLIYRTDKKQARLCPSCKKRKRAESLKRNNESCKSVKLKPKPERGYVGETDALFAFVRKVDRYNAEHGTSLSYGKFVDKVHNGKITL